MSSLDLSQRLLRYPLDLTGISPDNFVEAEIRDLPQTGNNRAVVLSNGAFYTESLVIYDNITGEILTKKDQYLAVQLVEAATVRAGKEICSVIVITDPSVSSQIRVNYQVVGGPYILNTDALAEMIAALNLDERPVIWGEIIGKPSLFPPGHHLHDVGDVFGFEYLVLGIEEIRKAIIMGDTASHDELHAYIAAVEDAFNAYILTASNALNAHKQDINNPHQTTSTQVGLGNVSNYPVATQIEAEAGTANDRYMTPLRVAQEITVKAGALLTTHINDHNNPHAVTQAQVGLGSVQNYGIATQTEAQLGTVNDKYMTPLRVAQAITQQAGSMLTTHINDHNNPHATTAAQVGLGSVANYSVATLLEAQAGSASDKYMTPQRVNDAIIAIANPAAQGMVNTHANRTDNPHSVTKAQVGLGNVPNYAVADSATAIAGVDNASFMTPLRVKEAIQNTQAGIDNRYVRKAFAEDTSLQVVGGTLQAYVAGAWRIVWPPQWQ